MPNSPSSPEPVSQSTTISVWLERGIYVAILLSCAMALSPNLADADLWGHVQYGQDAFRDGIARTTTYSFTADGHPWINHEHLSELILAGVASLGGGAALMVMKCLLGMIVIGLIVRAARQQQAGVVATCVVALLVSVTMTYHWSVRPQIFSFLLFALLIALVNWAFDGWQGKWHLPVIRQAARAGPPTTLTYDRWRMRCLWLAPLIFFVWANTHGGFVAGWCIYTLLLGCRAIEVLVRRGRGGWGVVRRLALMALVAGLATMVNPYGPGLQQWLLHSLTMPRPEIAEWHPPELLSLLTLPLLLTTGLWFLSICGSRKPLDFAQLVVVSVTLWQALEHQRHVPFFVILFGFWAVPHVQSLLDRLRRDAPDVPLGSDMSPVMQRAFAGALMLALILLGARLYGRLHELQVRKDAFPVEAMQYMADRDLRGNLVVTYNWAQYAIAAFCTNEAAHDPRMRVGADGRFRTCYPTSLLDMHFDFILGKGGPQHRWRSPDSPPFDPSAILAFKDPDLVLISTRQVHATAVMREQGSDWVLLYRDELAELWGQGSRFGNPTHPQFVPEQDRLITERPQIGHVSWPALPEFSPQRGALADASPAQKKQPSQEK